VAQVSFGANGGVVGDPGSLGPHGLTVRTSRDITVPGAEERQQERHACWRRSPDYVRVPGPGGYVAKLRVAHRPQRPIHLGHERRAANTRHRHGSTVPGGSLELEPGWCVRDPNPLSRESDHWPCDAEGRFQQVDGVLGGDVGDPWGRRGCWAPLRTSPRTRHRYRFGAHHSLGLLGGLPTVPTW